MIQNLGDLFLGLSLSDTNNLVKTEENPIENPESGNDGVLSIPETLPILPLRGLVVYPQTAVPLTIGQPRSIRLVDDVVSGNRIIGLVTAKNPELENPGPEDLYSVGTVAIIHRLFRTPDGTIRILIQGISRFHLGEFTSLEPYLVAKITPATEVVSESLETEALARNARDQFEHIAKMIPSIPRELVDSITNISDPLQTAYSIANFERMELADAQAILELDPVDEKLRKLVSILVRESEVLDLGQKIQNEARSEIEKVQRDYFLREQLKAIQKELGEGDEQTEDINDLRKSIDEAEMPEEALKQANRELERLSRLPTAAAEYGVIRSYIEWLAALPWKKSTEDNLDIINARKVLDEDHYGLNDVKERILEYLAVRKLRLERKTELDSAKRNDLIRKEREGVILCFVGPPGVGKTSLGQSIARALGRKFIRISLGGMRDEAEIRGHRRTYIGALPGRILQALRRVESYNPVFMLDEIDKLGFDFHGDPASALLEVLDPEQNFEFRDHYLEVAFDLSQVMFITTANTLETIPAPLLDRMEVIQIAGYTEQEKLNIARNYLIPRQIAENGLLNKEIKLDDDGILSIIRQYTREAGVRNLEREIGAICRKIVTTISEGKRHRGKIGEKEVHNLLGRPKFMGNEEIERRTSIPGVATGLAWTPTGGDILFIEASKMPGSKGFQITGSIGTVMQESAHAALTFVRSHAKEMNIDPQFFQKEDIHLHVPAGATPKDGPSAGVTMTTALISLLTDRPIRADLGMTGEITLRGQILPVGGIKEKMLAAHRAGLKTIILPKLNEPDLDDIPQEIRKDMEFHLVEHMDDVIKIAIPKKKAKK
ncbi:endopeptidase La [Leptolinea tardivitalis]|uniref:endopeptidase La n=1 Tax=Leptolinea tardivitalis TaxID=229920 RepID=UPI0009D6E557|nr:endopeptidase La [Leptolinea tardivitalis]